MKYVKENTDITEKAKQVFSETNGNNCQNGSSELPTDTKESPECAGIIKLNAKECLFCGSEIEIE